MSVKFIDNNAFYGFRTRRTVASVLYQEYFPLTVNGKRLGLRTKSGKIARADAERRDAELIEMKLKHAIATKGSRCFHKDGSLKGISLLYKKERSGNVSPIYQIGIQSEIENKVICSSISINAHGEKGAWVKIVKAFCHHKNIKKNSVLYKKIMKARIALDHARI